jgi:hypothetical protein
MENFKRELHFHARDGDKTGLVVGIAELKLQN